MWFHQVRIGLKLGCDKNDQTECPVRGVLSMTEAKTGHQEIICKREK